MQTQSVEKNLRINLGVGRFDVTERTARIYNWITGLIFLGLSTIFTISLVREESTNLLDRMLPIAYFFVSLFYIFKTSIVQSKSSKFAPHFLFSDGGMKIKTSVLKNSQFINWDEIRKIELGNYKIGIKDKTGLQYYPYRTRKKTSIQIKRAIEALAAERGIEVDNLLRR